MNASRIAHTPLEAYTNKAFGFENTFPENREADLFLTGSP